MRHHRRTRRVTVHTVHLPRRTAFYLTNTRSYLHRTNSSRDLFHTGVTHSSSPDLVCGFSSRDPSPHPSDEWLLNKGNALE
jgi:hypothetical protein